MLKMSEKDKIKERGGSFGGMVGFNLIKRRTYDEPKSVPVLRKVKDFVKDNQELVAAILLITAFCGAFGVALLYRNGTRAAVSTVINNSVNSVTTSVNNSVTTSVGGIFTSGSSHITNTSHVVITGSDGTVKIINSNGSTGTHQTIITNPNGTIQIIDGDNEAETDEKK